MYSVAEQDNFLKECLIIEPKGLTNFPVSPFHVGIIPFLTFPALAYNDMIVSQLAYIPWDTLSAAELFLRLGESIKKYYYLSRELVL